MRKAIATVSMSGTLREKLEAIAAARFDGFELFEPDLINYNGTPAEVGAIAADLGLACELYQPFRDFEGSPDAVFQRNLDRAERKFDVMEAVGAQLMLVCSNTQPNVLPEEERAAEQLHQLAERAARRNLRIGFEALAWGRRTNLFSQAWAIVQRANHPHLGLILDSFHTLSLRDDPSGIAKIPGDKIFFVQLADAPLLVMDVLQWARHYRNFPGQGQFDLENFFELVLLAGYTGPLSLEVFNDSVPRDAESAHGRRRDAIAALPGRASPQPDGGCRESRRRERGCARAGDRPHRAVRSASRPGAVGHRVSRVRRRRGVRAHAGRIDRAPRIPARRKASVQGRHAIPARRYQPDPERGSQLLRAEAFSRTRPVGLRDRIAHGGPGARAEPGDCAAMRAVRQPHRR